MKIIGLEYENSLTGDNFRSYGKALKSVQENKGSRLVYTDTSSRPGDVAADKIAVWGEHRPCVTVFFDSVHEMLQTMFLTSYGQQFGIYHEKNHQQRKQAILSTRVTHEKAAEDLQTETWSTTVSYEWASLFAQACFKDEAIKGGMASLYGTAVLCERGGRVSWEWRYGYKTGVKGKEQCLFIESVPLGGYLQEGIQEAAREEIKRMIEGNGKPYSQDDWKESVWYTSEPLFVAGWFNPHTKASGRFNQDIQKRREEWESMAIDEPEIDDYNWEQED